MCSTSAQFAVAHKALHTTLQQLKNTATGGTMLPSTMPYQESDQNQKHNDDRMIVTAKCLKLLNRSTPCGLNHGGPNRHDMPMETPHDSPPPTHLNPPYHDCGPSIHQDQHPWAGDVIYAVDGFMPLPEGHKQRFCVAFLWKGGYMLTKPLPHSSHLYQYLTSG